MVGSAGSDGGSGDENVGPRPAHWTHGPHAIFCQRMVFIFFSMVVKKKLKGGDYFP